MYWLLFYEPFMHDIFWQYNIDETKVVQKTEQQKTDTIFFELQCVPKKGGGGAYVVALIFEFCFSPEQRAN